MLFLYALARPVLSDSPSATLPSLRAPIPDHNVSAECDDFHYCRTLTNVVWSCWSVVFISTWVSIHPNVPKYGEHPAVVVMKNGITMFMALIAPELIVLWSMRQWFSARKIAKQFKKYHWGMTHAFFVLMGGFALYDGDEFLFFLWEDWNKTPGAGQDRRIMEEIAATGRGHKTADDPQDSNVSHSGQSYSCLLEFLLDNDFIKLTEAEIQDRSHADALTKGIALIQTTWFILQCIARAIQGLTVTELEIITMAFALLNFIVYFLWWNKPLRVRYPVRVTHRASPPSKAAAPRSPNVQMSACAAIIASIRSNFDNTCRNFPLPRVVTFLLWPLLSLLTKFNRMLVGQNMDDAGNPFSSRLAKDPVRMYAACYSIAVGFGALHCIGWSFHFLSEAERLQWQILSLMVTFLPVVLGVVHLSVTHRNAIAAFLEDWPKWFAKLLSAIVVLSILLLAITYIVARVWLIVLALMALRELPNGAYKTPQWTTFIPHVG
ncbi:hypothetical protein Moror_3452 [Moniliophthora roreri MCA 2997]|uniref:Uncharacterized protein n=1 Tax=Moniliophthora roreri (strain MCA 2997) TaxID=1381753 RepID=V2WZ46_MONRO|nr:hypothetical protein Moror_3452 [Moniliophthora roreri MCA 2997]